MAGYNETLLALADGTRRALLDALRAGPLTVGQLAQRLPVSQPAVSQHLKVLREAELVAVTEEGTRHVYRLRPDGLTALRAYIDSFWDDVLDAFAKGVQATPADSQTRERKRTARRGRGNARGNKANRSRS